MRVQEFKRKVKDWGYFVFLVTTLMALFAGAFSWRPTFNKFKVEGDLRFVDSAVIFQILGSVDLVKPHRLEEIERKLEELEPIREAHLFISHDSTLVVRVEEHVPIARIITSTGENYYMAEDGTLFLITEVSKPVYVPVALLTEETMPLNERINDLKTLIESINKDDFLSSITAHLTYSSSQGWILISRIDRQKVIIGEVDRRLDGKLNKLRKFYKFVKKHGLWQTYKKIDLRYKNQLVASK